MINEHSHTIRPLLYTSGCLRVHGLEIPNDLPVSAVESRDDVDVAGVWVDDAGGGEVVSHAAVVREAHGEVPGVE